MKKSDIRKMVREALVKGLAEADGEPEEKKDPEIEKAKKPVEPAPPTPQTDGSSPAEKAHALNLVYQGWGKWADASGMPVAKTMGDQLVRIDSNNPYSAPEQQAAPEQPAAAPPPGPESAQLGQQSTAKPPLKNGQPIEVSVHGQNGYIDGVQDGAVLVTLHSGQSISVPKDQVQRPSTAELNADELGIPPKVEKVMNKIFKDAGRDPYKPAGEPGIRPGWNRGMDTNDVPYDANGEATVQKLLAMIGDPVKLVRWLVKKFQTETPNGKQRIMQYLGIIKDMGLLNGNKEEMPPV